MPQKSFAAGNLNDHSQHSYSHTPHLSNLNRGDVGHNPNKITQLQYQPYKSNNEMLSSHMSTMTSNMGLPGADRTGTDFGPYDFAMNEAYRKQ
mmetsp:Transcript_22473/g.19425  ORF Transcript_22473/g.19425 Transcript_22473/m.19425 type:complete len:93 (-) Transcript_22473:909-1187(-)